MDTRAMHEIKTDAMRISQVALPDAIDAGNWLAVHRLCEQLEEIVQRGLYHQSKERMAELNAFAMGNHSERDPH